MTNGNNSNRSITCFLGKKFLCKTMSIKSKIGLHILCNLIISGNDTTNEYRIFLGHSPLKKCLAMRTGRR